MGKWETELNKTLKWIEELKQGYEKEMKSIDAIVAAAQAVIGGQVKFGPKYTKFLSVAMDEAEVSGRAAAELSVYEEELEAAKKKNDKAQVKKIEAKMKPLSKDFEDSKKRFNSEAGVLDKEAISMGSLIEALMKLPKP